MPRRRSSRAAFTLVEVIVVVAIIAVSAAVAVPAVRSGQRQREVRQTLQHFVAAIREASAKAVLQRRTVELWVRREDRCYELAVPIPVEERTEEQDSTEEHPADELGDLERAEGRRIIGRVKLPVLASFGEIRGGRVLADDVVAFPFRPTGGSSGGQVELVFESGSFRATYTIGFDPLVSAIELKQPES